MFSNTFGRLILTCIIYLILNSNPVFALEPSSPCATPLVLKLSNCTVDDTTVDSWGIQLTLGDPPQEVCVAPSTVVNSTLVLGSDFCQNPPNMTVAQCLSLCGNTFGTSTAGNSYNSSTPSTVLAPNPDWDDFSPQALLAGTTELQLPSSIDISSYPIGIITKGNNQNVGHLGLANDSDLIKSVISAGLIPANGFSLDAGSQSVANPRDGSLVLGGIDLASVNGPFQTFPISSESPNDRHCPLQLTISELILRFPQKENYSEITIISRGFDFTACIEPYDNLLRLPQTAFENFQRATNWNSETTADPNLYIVEPGLYYPKSTVFNGSLIFKFKGDLTVEIPNNELAMPLSGINTNGARVLDPNITVVNVFSDPVRLDTATLGKVFLSQLYLSVDYTTQEFKLSDLIPDPKYKNIIPFDSARTACSSQTKSKTNTDGLSTGSKTGIIIASIAFALVILCTIAIFYLWRARRDLNRRLEQMQTEMKGLQSHLKPAFTPPPSLLPLPLPSPSPTRPREEEEEEEEEEVQGQRVPRLLRIPLFGNSPQDSPRLSISTR